MGSTPQCYHTNMQYPNTLPLTLMIKIIQIRISHVLFIRPFSFTPLCPSITTAMRDKNGILWQKTFKIQGERVDLKVQNEHYRILFASWFKSLSLTILSVRKTLSYLHNSQVQLMIKLTKTHLLLVHINALMIMHKKADTLSL